MDLPSPTEKQVRVLWFSLLTLALGVLLTLLGLAFWALGWAVNRLSSVLLPLALAGILACLLDPVVDFLERKKIPRGRGILLVFLLALLWVLILALTVIPRLIVEAGQLTDQVPIYAARLRAALSETLATLP